MKLPLSALLLLAACGSSPATEPGPSTVDRGSAASFTGAEAVQQVLCEPGEYAIGGECLSYDAAILESHVTPDGRGWTCRVRLTEPAKGCTVIAVAHCGRGT